MLQDLINKRIEHADRYIDALQGIGDITVPKSINPKYFHSYSNFVINTEKRDDLVKSLMKNGIEVMVHWNPSVADLKIFQKYLPRGGELKVVKRYTATCLSLPISPWMSEQERGFVIDKIIEFYKG